MAVIPQVLIGSIAAALAYLFALAATAVWLALRTGGRREDPVDDHDALSVSRFTIPISLLVPARHDSSGLSTTIDALLNLNYPELEVIVVAEGAAADQLSALKREWRLEAKEFYYRQSLATDDVQRIYRSGRDARLMVVEKTASASRADALNCGVNLARFRYVASVQPGLVFDADALLRAMSAPLRDPAGVVAATSHVETHAIGDARDQPAMPASSSMRLHGALQRLSSIRSLMDSRLVWRTLQAAVGPHGAVAVWRRDAIVQLGGFSTHAADPDLDMMVRLQTSTTAQISGRVVRSSEIFGRISPRSLASTLSLRTRRQLAVLQAIWVCRKLNGSTFAYVVLSELLTPFAQAWIVAATTAGALAGWFSWSIPVNAIVLLSFGNAIISALALLVRGASPGSPDEASSRHLLLVAPLDFIVSGVVGACARAAGLWAFLRGAFRTRVPV